MAVLRLLAFVAIIATAAVCADAQLADVQTSWPALRAAL